MPLEDPAVVTLRMTIGGVLSRRGRLGGVDLLLT